MSHRGQYQIVNEVVIFAIGIAITSYVAFSFSGVQKNISYMTKVDQIDSVASMLSLSIIKSAETTGNNTISLHIPKTISGSEYVIKASGNVLFIYFLKEPHLNVSKQLFNINETHSITGEIISSAEYIEIQKLGNSIKLVRVKEF